MRILFIHHSLKKNINKFRGSINIYSQLFKKNGHKVEIIPREGWSAFFKKYNSFKPNIIITCGPIAGFIALFNKLGLIKSKLIFHWGDNYEETANERWKRYFLRFLEELAVKYSDIIISISRYRLERGINEFNKKENKNIFYLPMGYNPNFLKKAKRIKLPGKNKIKVVYSGELSRVKKYPELKKAIEKLKKIDFVLVGGVENGEKTKNTQNSFYLGWKEPNEVYGHLLSADFLLLTEDNDSSSKLFEYQVLGKPVLAPRGKISKYLDFKNNLYYDGFLDISKLIKTKKKFKPQKIKAWDELSKKYLKIITKN